MKKGIYAILALLTVLAMVMTGCPSEPDETLYTVTFNSNGATGGTTPSKITQSSEGAAITLPDAGSLVKTGYTFDGWSETAGGAKLTGTTYKPTKDITLYAVWKQTAEPGTPATLTFNGNGATGGTPPANITTGKVGDMIALPDNTGGLEKTGFIWQGWATTNNATTAITGTYTITGDVTLYAVWEAENPDAMKVTFNMNAPAYAPITPATTIVQVTGETVGSKMPPNPTYNAAWDAGVTFDGWNTKADGTGTAFTATTQLNVDIEVFAQWKFTAGTPTGTDPLVQTGLTLEATGGSQQGTFAGTINKDGSVTISEGAFKCKLPDAYTGYDFFEIAFVYTFTGAKTDVPNNMIFKRGETSGDFFVVGGSQYWKPDANTVSGTVTKKFAVVTGVDTLSIQLYWGNEVTSHTPFTMKYNTVTLSKSPKHTITFDVDGGTAIEPLEITEGQEFTLPVPVKAGNTFTGWYSGEELVTGKTAVTSNITIKAKWKTTSAVSDTNVAFTASMLTTMGGGTVTVINAGAGYAFQYADGASYQGNQVKFKFTLPTGAALADFGGVAATIAGKYNGAVSGGSPTPVTYKTVGLVAAADLGTAFATNPLDGPNVISTGNYTVGTATIVFPINAGYGLTGELEFCIYTPADGDNTNGTRVFEVTDVKFLSPAAPAAPLTINVTAAGENGSIVQADVSGSDYAGISFDLRSSFAGKSIRSYNRITFVTESYSDQGTTAITTGNNLYTATLFTPFAGYASDDFPGYGTPGRLQAIGAGANANGPNGYTAPITTISTPEGIRFERDGSGSALRNIKIVSITFSHTAYGQ